MDIRSQCDRAYEILKGGDYHSALTIALTAMSAAARLKRPKPYPDNKAFKEYFRSRCQLDIAISYQGKSIGMEDVFYTHIRNTLFHEAALPNEITFAARTDHALSAYTDGQRVILSISWISELLNMIARDPDLRDQFP